MTTRCLMALTCALLLGASSAQAAVNVSRFSVTPSTTRAGAHPTLDFQLAFEPATADVRDIRLHLPAGVSASPGAAPFCSRGRLVDDLCPLSTKVGSVRLVGEAFGFEAEIRRNIYNVRPSGGERLRLGIPIVGGLDRGGVALMLLVTPRPGDGGLDVSIAGPPREVAGYTIGLREVGFRLRGTVRRKVGGRVRRRAYLTNPSSCGPATTVLEITTHVGPPPVLTRESTFTPTGCG